MFLFKMYAKLNRIFSKKFIVFLHETEVLKISDAVNDIITLVFKINEKSS